MERHSYSINHERKFVAWMEWNAIREDLPLTVLDCVALHPG